MPDFKMFRLPDVGEGLTEAEVVSWRVQPGDTVKINDIVVEIETAKSLVELPCPFAGQVAELLVPEGQTVAVGTPIISVDVDPGGAPAAPDAGGSGARAAATDASTPSSATEIEQAPEEGAIEPGLIGGPAPGGRTSVLVGYGPRTTSAARRPRKANVDTFAEMPTKPQRHGGLEVGRIVEQQLTEAAERPPVEPHRRPHAPGHGPVVHAAGRVLAKPPVRKLAKDLGVDLSEVTPTGPNGTVSRDDVQAYADSASSPELAHSSDPTLETAAAGTAYSASGERETRVPIKGVRKMTAQAMVASAFTAPHVTEFVTVDVTRTMKLVHRLRDDRAFAGVKVSPLLLVAKALLLSVRRNPGINASWDEANQEIVVKHYVNLGIAAATPRGLVVPNTKDAHAMPLREMADAMAKLTATAREGRTQPAEMSGGTISITNVGTFGVDTGTPILNLGEAAILCIGQIADRPWVHKGKVVPRQVTTLGVSFDHRLVDGDLGSRFLSDIAQLLEDPQKGLLWA